MSSTSPGMSIHGSADTSWTISPIGNSGARSSGPTGSRVAGCSGGCSGAGIAGSTLNHAVGIWSAGRSKRIGVLLSVGSRRGTSARRECSHERGRVVGAHQCLADEHGVEAGGGHALGVVDARGSRSRRPRSTSGGMRVDHAARRSTGPRRTSTGRARSRRRCGAPIASARSSSASSCTSTSDREPAVDGVVVEVAQLRVVECGDDQQDGVGAHHPGFVDLQSRRREVLAQHRDARWPRGPRPRSARAAAEVRAVGEHRQARRATAPRTPRAVAAGSRSGARSPFDGDRRLISAITRDADRRRARPRSRAPAAASATADVEICATPARAPSTSSRFVPMISANTLLMPMRVRVCHSARVAAAARIQRGVPRCGVTHCHRCTVTTLAGRA